MTRPVSGGAGLPGQLPVPWGYVRLTCSDPGMDVVARLGANSPHYSAGFGGWEITARPRQVGMTTWQGTEPLAMELDLIFDGFGTGQDNTGAPTHTSQEDALKALYAVARGDDESPPGIVYVNGIPTAVDEWVVEALDIGDAILDDDGSRVRQGITVTLREWVPPTFLQLRKGALAKSKGKTKVITVKKGDTPAIIARREHCKWTDIRALNKRVVTKANQNLKDGSKLRVPMRARRDRRAKGSARSRKSAQSTRSD
jgi:hypothetical protein